MDTAAAESVSYEYDELNRLTRVRYGDGTVTTFAYDAAGNITRTETRASP
jgi:YD repeat-containing protein